MKLPVYNIKAEKIGEVTLSPSYFSVSPNQTLLAQAIRSYLANQRTSHAKTKHRGEVAGTTKKMWAQKGTGRARHGSAKAPIFVGGGSAHGPRGDRNFSLSLSQKQKVSALKSALSLQAAAKSILIVDGLDSLSGKTKDAWKFIDLLEKENKTLADSQRIGIITQKSSLVVKKSFGNIPGFTLMSLSSLNPYSLSLQNCLIFSKKAISCLK